MEIAMMVYAAPYTMNAEPLLRIAMFPLDARKNTAYAIN